jgi:hypothetical protein
VTLLMNEFVGATKRIEIEQDDLARSASLSSLPPVFSQPLPRNSGARTRATRQ